MLSDEEREALQYFNTETKTEAMHYGAVLVKLIEKQSKEIEECKKQLDLDNECEIALNNKVMDLEKEIEELKEERKSYAEEYIYNNPWLYKQLNENYILRVESEQKERKAYIKGTNDAHELCNKKWEDKTKAKIEEYEKELNKLLQKEEWLEPHDTIKRNKYMHYIEFGKSLLEKE